MNDQAPSPVPKIVVIVVSVLAILYGLISTCTGGLGLVGQVTALAAIGEAFLIQGIVGAAISTLSLLSCLLLVISGIVALVKRGVGRWALIASLGIVLVVDLLAWVAGVVTQVLTAGGNIGDILIPLLVGGIVGIVVLVIKCLLYVIAMALLLFLGKEG